MTGSLPTNNPRQSSPKCLELGEEDPVAQILQAMKRDDDEEKKHAILCKQCDHVITRPENILIIHDKFIHSFINPSGFQFDIQCYSEAEGSLISGNPTDFFSWFPGYAWQFCYCNKCSNHIGWFYSKNDERFFGLNLAMLKGDI